MWSEFEVMVATMGEQGRVSCVRSFSSTQKAREEGERHISIESCCKKGRLFTLLQPRVTHGKHIIGTLNPLNKFRLRL